MQTKDVIEIFANLATIAGLIGIVILFRQRNANKDIRNLELMHRCLDGFKEWSSKSAPKIDFFYLELLNEELFYFQREFIEQKVAIEWIEGILDYIQVYGAKGEILTQYTHQVNIESLTVWQERKGFFSRIHFFLYPGLDSSFIVPGYDDPSHRTKKRQLALQLYTHIKNYQY